MDKAWNFRDIAERIVSTRDKRRKRETI